MIVDKRLLKICLRIEFREKIKFLKKVCNSRRDLLRIISGLMMEL